MSRNKHVRDLIKKHGKVSAKKQFQRMASFSYDGLNLDHLGDEVKSIIKSAVIEMGKRGLDYLANDEKIRKVCGDSYIETTQQLELYGKYINSKAGKDEKDNDNS